MIRAALVALAAAMLVEPPTAAIAWSVVGATACLAALDGLDGWLARRFGLASAFGARFDVEVDALLILVLSLFVWRHDKAGVWVLACGLMRYAFVAAGWVLPWMNGPLRPTLRGKSVAVTQFAGLGLALAPVVPTPASARSPTGCCGSRSQPNQLGHLLLLRQPIYLLQSVTDPTQSSATRFHQARRPLVVAAR